MILDGRSSDLPLPPDPFEGFYDVKPVEDHIISPL